MLAPSYRSIVWTTRVTAAFSLIVAAGLATSLLGQQAVLPLDDPPYLALKDQLAADGERPARQEQLRRLDVDLRRTYFRQQTFRRRGSYLLLGGVSATLLLAHWSTTKRRRMPLPQPRVTLHDPETRQNRLGQWASVALVAAVAVAVLLSQRSSPRFLQGSDTVVADGRSEAPHPAPAPLTDAAPAAAVAAPQPLAAESSLPTPEQIARNWPRFRGPTGCGDAAFSDVPETWDGTTGEGILWKTAIELPGVSSPIIWDGRVFLTGATADRREVCCIAADSGKMLWTRAVAETSDDSAEIKVEEATGYAAPTPATDGQRVYAIFASGDLVACDFDGQLVWSLALGRLANPYGHASSLVTYRDLLFVQLDQGTPADDKSRLLAIRGATGEIVWQTPRAVAASWSTPLVVEYQGQPRIITSAEPGVIAYAADDGRELWRAECLEGDIGPSPVYDAGVVYVANDNAVAAAIRDGGEGDVTDSHILWTADFALPDICSPLLTETQVLLVAAYGGLVSYDRETGGAEPIWEEDLGTMLMASPCRVADRVYLISEEGKGWVVKTRDTGMERIAENDLGERCLASPAFQPGRIFIRGEQHLFCIGKP